MTNGKKGMGTGLKVALGCGCLLMMGGLGAMGVVGFGLFKAKEVVQDIAENPTKTMAETAIRLNPDLDLVSTDESAGTITFDNNKTGERATLNFEEIAEGNFSVTTDEGEFSVDFSDAEEGGGVVFQNPDGETRVASGAAAMDEVPDWVPRYPGATETQAGMVMSGADGSGGAITSKSSDGAQKVVDYFKAWFENNGFSVTSTSVTSTGDGNFGNIQGESADGKTLNFMVIEQGGESQLTTSYSDN